MTSTSQQPLSVPSHSLDAQIGALLHEAQHHPALEHAFLRRFANGDFADNLAALRLYAREYSGYAQWFPHYLRAVIARLTDPEHRALLGQNLNEEQGLYGDDECAELREAGIEPASVQGVPHPQLFRRFCHAVGIGDAELATARPAAARWRESFRAYLETASPAAAVGALGIGTEFVVRPIYQQLVAGIRATGQLRREQFVFFELHCLVDDKHQQDLLHIARDLATADGGIDELRHGVHTALDLRNRFWDELYDQLQHQEPSQTVSGL